MADNIDVTPGSGATVAADEVTDGTLGVIKVQYVKVMDGTINSTNKLLVGSNGAQAVMLATDGISSAGVLLTPKRAFSNVASGATNVSLVAAVTSKKIRVLQFAFFGGSAATNITFNTLGAGTAISPLFANDIYGGGVFPFSSMGWFETATGEGLGVTTNASGTPTGVLVGYVEV